MIYTWECPLCGEEDETCGPMCYVTSFVPKCPKCSVPMERTIGKTSFALKGDGWARDGYSKRKEEQ